MVLTFDPSPDFADVVDGLEAVTLNRRGSSDDVAVASALRREVTTKEAAASDGKYAAGDTRWHFPTDEVADTPNVGDTIVEAGGDRYHILSVNRDTLSARWKCVSRNLTIFYGLDRVVTIRKSKKTNTKGVSTRSWRTVRTVAARVQPVGGEDPRLAGAENRTEHNARQLVKSVSIFLAEDIELTPAHRIVEPDGTQWDVKSYQGDKTVGRFEVAASEAPRE